MKWNNKPLVKVHVFPLQIGNFLIINKAAIFSKKFRTINTS